MVRAFLGHFTLGVTLDTLLIILLIESTALPLGRLRHGNESVHVTLILGHVSVVGLGTRQTPTGHSARKSAHGRIPNLGGGNGVEQRLRLHWDLWLDTSFVTDTGHICALSTVNFFDGATRSCYRTVALIAIVQCLSYSPPKGVILLSLFLSFSVLESTTNLQ